MPITLYCPSCGTALNIRDDAPMHLTCPACVAPLVNPMVSAPLPVLPIAPVDREAGRDARTVRHVMILVALLLAAAAVLTAMTVGAGNAIFHVLIMLLVLAFVGVGIHEGGERHAMTLRTEAEAAEAMRAAQEADAPHGDGGHTLDYRRPRAYQRGREPMGVGAVTGGLFASLGVCATGFFVLLGTLDLPREQHANILLGVVLMVLMFIFAAPYFASRRGWRGFGLGATIGMVLGLLALGPCAFCYTMTI